MSQPIDIDNSQAPHDPLDQPLVDTNQLVKIFTDAQKEPKDASLGVEYEIFAQDMKAKRPLPYQGPISITSLYEEVAKNSANETNPFKRITEGNNLVALYNSQATLALEPGGQLEIALCPYRDASLIGPALTEVFCQLQSAADKLGIKLFAAGLHPLAFRHEMAVVKKKRYKIMKNYMGKLDGLGLDMMLRSCALQVNIDFENEQDMSQKLRLAAVLSPLFSSLSSTAAFLGGHKTTIALARSRVWQHTDPARTGIPPVIFEKQLNFLSWIEYALDVPMYFIRRGSTYYDVSGESFRKFMKNGLSNQTATVRDFADHLSTIFTEVRLKPFIEIRSPDSSPICYIQSFCALIQGLFYSKEALDQATQIFSECTYQEFSQMSSQSIEMGLKAGFRDQSLSELAQKLIEIANDSLGKKNLQAARLLSPLNQIAVSNNPIDEVIKKRFSSISNENIGDLINLLSPLAPTFDHHES